MIEFEFVVTEELQEFIDEMKKTFKLLKDPKALLEGIGLLFCFVSIYFICVMLSCIAGHI